MWVLSRYAGRIPKKGPVPRGYALTAVEIDRAEWVHENRHRIADFVLRIHDHDVLQQVAKLIDYKEKAT
jgi:hypothetical protein